MTLEITGTDTLGVVHTLPFPFWVTYESDIKAPADSVKLTFLTDDIPDIVMIEIQGDIVFDGVVDLITRTKSHTAKKCVIYARSIAAILLDSEAPIGWKRVLDIDMVYRTVNCEGKLKGFEYDTYTPLQSITIPKGTSLWKYLTLFCEQAMGHTPHLTQDGYICAKPYPDDIIHNFDVNTPYECEERTDYSDAIMTVSVRGANGNYSYALINTDIRLPFERHRFINTGAAWANYPTEYGRKILKKSLIDYKTSVLNFKGFINAKVGEGAVYNSEEKCVFSVKHTLSEDGVSTCILLGDRKYL